MPSEEELASFYPDTYYAYGSSARRPAWKRLLTKLLQMSISTYDPAFAAPGKFLDVGSGSGQYVSRMRRRGWDAYGVEPSKSAVDLGRRDEQLNLVCGTLPSARFPSEEFDYIRSNHSFEHIPNPVEVLTEMHRILKPEGKLFIGVPNIDSLPFRIFGRYWWYLGAPVHTYNYSVKTLSSLLAQCGFTVEHVYYNSNFASILGSLQIFFNRNSSRTSMQGLTVRNPLFMVISNLVTRVFDLFRVGDAIEVICRKTAGIGTDAANG